MSAAAAPSKPKEKKAKTEEEKKVIEENRKKLQDYRNEVRAKFNKSTALLVGLDLIENNFDSGDFTKLLTKVVTYNVMANVNQIHESEKLSADVDLYKPSEYTIIPEKKPTKPKKSVKDVADTTTKSKINLNIDDEDTNGDEAKNTEAGDEEAEADDAADDAADDGDEEEQAANDADESPSEEKKDSGKKGKKNAVIVSVQGRAYLCFLFSRIFREIYSIDKRLQSNEENVSENTIYKTINEEKYNKLYGEYRVFKHMQAVHQHFKVNLDSDQGFPDWIQKNLSSPNNHKANSTLMNYSVGVIKNYLALMCKIISRKILSQRGKITEGVIENAMRDIDLLIELNSGDSHINFSKLINDLRGIVKEITHNPYKPEKASKKNEADGGKKTETEATKTADGGKKTEAEATKTDDGEEEEEENTKKKPTKPASAKKTAPVVEEPPKAAAKSVRTMKSK